MRPGGVLTALVEALLPALCAHCGTPLPGGDRGLCQGCLTRLLPLSGTQCPQCGVPLEDAGECVQCRRQRPRWEGTVIWGDYDGVLRTAILALKHHGHDELARPLGRRLASRVASEPWSRDLTTVCWVASHPVRRLRRGRSAAFQLAAVVGSELGLPVRGVLRRRGWRRQAGASRRARLMLPLESFRIRTSARMERVLVVDDVTTTGATLARTAGLIRRCGATSVFAAVMARTPDTRRRS